MAPTFGFGPVDDADEPLEPLRAALLRCLQRHGISRLPEVEGHEPTRQASTLPRLRMFNSAVRVQDAVHVPYRAAASALQNMIAGRLDHYCLLAAAAVSFINDNSLQALAVLTAERSPLFPNLPTTQEQCIPVVDGYYWNAFFMRTALDRQAVQDRLRTAASTAVAPDRHSRHYLRTFLRSEITRWAAIMSSAGVAQQ